MSRGAEVGGTIVVRLPPGTFPLVPLAAEDADEGHLKLAVVVGVDDGVQAAVEIAQPEDDFEEQVGWAQVHIKRPWRQKERERERGNTAFSCQYVFVAGMELSTDAYNDSLLILLFNPITF